MNMELAAVLVAGSIIIATHMTARVFHAPEGNVLWRIARYTLGSVAILAGSFFLLEWSDWLKVLGVTVVAGLSTLLSYGAVELYNYHNRAVAAEDDADKSYEL